VAAKKTLKTGENGVRKHLMVFLDVDKLFSNIFQPITPNVLTNEKPPGTNTQCVFGGLKKSSGLFPQNFVLPNLVTLKTPSDDHHPPNHKLLLLL
jgi:hypothetical protein